MKGYRLFKSLRVYGLGLVLATAGISHAAEIPQPVRGQRGMVVAGHPEAVEIGLKVLQAGGNAIDAAVATSLALGVAEPYGSGMGGKCTVLYYEAATGKCWFIDGMDASGAGMDPPAFDQLEADLRREGPLGVGVPGLVAALGLAHEQWGRLEWADTVLPAAKLAEDGFTVVAGMPIFFERRIDRIRSHPEAERLYLVDGEIPKAGRRLVNRDMAKTLRTVADEGPSGFYAGWVAEAIVKELRAGGSHLELADFKNYEARRFEPLRITWEGYEIVSSPPPTKGGATVLLALEVLEGFDWEEPLSFDSPVNVSAWSHAFRIIYPVIERHFGDDPQAMEHWARLATPASLDRLRGALDAAMLAEPVAALPPIRPDRDEDTSTSHFVVADSEGNLVSVTQSLSHHFGSGVIAPGTGVLLNNSLKNFSTWDATAVNATAPEKRPTSTIAPTLVFKEGKPVLAIGLPGGSRIPTTLNKVLVERLRFGQGLGASIGAPRFQLRRSWSPTPDSRELQWETAPPASLLDALEARGWDSTVVTDSEYFGGITAIEVLEDGTYLGWADPRRTNHADGY
jgi:gamma-glutamyltranspeptidase/glutathione hydrolase